ncbi:hypothetical protein, partial [Staphylococcus aureus]|uniref:hypothetical protein n=1 Tax=Staphylococcus aureus TaxID=1280 RepID=UPI002181E70A
TNETGHVTIIPQQWIPKGDVSAKATRGSESVTSDPVEALNTDPQHRPFVIEVTTDPFTRIELRDKYNKPLGASRTNDKGHAYIVPTRPIPEGNVTAVATDEQMKLVMSLLFHNNGFLKVMFQRKPHVVQKA